MGWFPKVLIVNFVLVGVITAVRPMVSYRALAHGASAAEVGLIAAAFGLLAFPLAIPAGRWIDRLGEPAFVVLGAALMAVVTLVPLVVGGIAMLAISMAGLGLGHMVSALAAQTLIANAGAPEGRDARFGIQSMLASVGQVVGPLAAAVLLFVTARVDPSATTVPEGATDVVLIAAAIVALACCGMALTLWRHPPVDHPRHGGSAARERSTAREDVAGVVRVPGMPHALVASMAVLACEDVIIAYLPVHGAAAGLPVQLVTGLLVIRAVASVTSRAFTAPLRRRYSRQALLVWSMAAAGISVALVPAAGAGVAALVLTMVVSGLALGLGQPLTIAWVAARSPELIRGTAMGLRMTGSRFGQFMLPAAAGIVGGAAGTSAVFWGLGALLGATAALVVRSPGRDRASG